MSRPTLWHYNGGTDLNDPGDAGNVLTSNGTGWVSSPASGGMMVGFTVNDGSVATRATNTYASRQAGQVIKCVIVVTASDPTTDLTFKILQNGADVFSADPTVTHGTAADTLVTSTSLTSVPLAVAADDKFYLQITSGSSAWKFTAQLE